MSRGSCHGGREQLGCFGELKLILWVLNDCPSCRDDLRRRGKRSDQFSKAEQVRLMGRADGVTVKEQGTSPTAPVTSLREKDNFQKSQKGFSIRNE